MPNKKEQLVRVDRRNFLKGAGLAIGAAGATAVAAGNDAQAKSDEVATHDTGYRETEHVRTYYNLARF